jgi:hypothetical protein
MKNNLMILLIAIMQFSFYSCKNISQKDQPADTLMVKRTLAEIWYKTGGHFEDGKYIGGAEFKKFNSLRVPDECTDHSFFMKYEGPGWESDKIGYRLYLDWRNAIDIFGKKVDTLVLPYVGQDGYESYHLMADWGQDILKVGESLGIGTLGFWDGKKAQRVAETDSVYCSIAEDGNSRSEVQIDYYGWKIDNSSVNLSTSLSIEAGSRATKYTIGIDGKLSNLCTGIVKLEETSIIQDTNKTGWNYLATWGKQSLSGDSLGLAVLFRANQLSEITSDELSHVIVLNPIDNKLEYYFLGAWEKEPEGIKSKKEFIVYLEELAKSLNTVLGK